MRLFLAGAAFGFASAAVFVGGARVGADTLVLLFQPDTAETGPGEPVVCGAAFGAAATEAVLSALEELPPPTRLEMNDPTLASGLLEVELGEVGAGARCVCVPEEVAFVEVCQPDGAGEAVAGLAACFTGGAFEIGSALAAGVVLTAAVADGGARTPASL